MSMCLLSLGASAKERRNKRMHWLNASVAEFKDDISGLTMQHDNATSYHPY